MKLYTLHFLWLLFFLVIFERKQLNFKRSDITNCKLIKMIIIEAIK